MLLLSSTRVYARSGNTDEVAVLPCLSSDPSDLYNLSKLMGEALVLQDPRPGLKVVRISNVVGPQQPVSTFVGSLLEEADSTGEVTIQQPPSMAKIAALQDVVRLLPQIMVHGRQRLYNLGFGRNTTHQEVAAWLERQGVTVRFASQASPCLRFPELSIHRLSAEFEPPGPPFLQTLRSFRSAHGPPV